MVSSRFLSSASMAAVSFSSRFSSSGFSATGSSAEISSDGSIISADASVGIATAVSVFTATAAS
jgi:hypothetical protein